MWYINIRVEIRENRYKLTQGSMQGSKQHNDKNVKPLQNNPSRGKPE